MMVTRARRAHYARWNKKLQMSLRMEIQFARKMGEPE